ncbi:hypothetical protein CLOP_g6299 [Closterium sp. NIES-67]|nr:hypothetical protein CLOP_g6299 [Closterium sp. NIES-67]
MFQLTMNGVFRDLLDKCVIIYLDNILIFNKTKEQHLKDLDTVFQRLQQNRLITKGSKCEFLKSELEFFEHAVGADDIKIDPQTDRQTKHTIQTMEQLTRTNCPDPAQSGVV